SEMIAGNDRVNGTTDKLPTPEQVQKQVASQDNRQMVFSPSITIPPSSGNPEADQRLIDSLIERMKAELMPMMGGGELAVRLDASLSDRSNT
ncbi:phage tail tape measure protein, partial [Vibrio cholerae]|nr:phage tail tape measure protein [Vibrio cholerae]